MCSKEQSFIFISHYYLAVLEMAPIASGIQYTELWLKPIISFNVCQNQQPFSAIKFRLIQYFSCCHGFLFWCTSFHSKCKQSASYVFSLTLWIQKGAIQFVISMHCTKNQYSLVFHMQNLFTLTQDALHHSNFRQSFRTM